MAGSGSSYSWFSLALACICICLAELAYKHPAERAMSQNDEDTNQDIKVASGCTFTRTGLGPFLSMGWVVVVGVCSELRQRGARVPRAFRRQLGNGGQHRVW